MQPNKFKSIKDDLMCVD